MQRTRPRLIIINQTVNPAVIAWAQSLAAENGPIELWSGNAPDDLGPHIMVRRSPAYDKSSVRSRLWTWGWFTLVCGSRLLMRRDRPPLFVFTNPPFMPLLVGALHTLRGYRFGLMEWDIYPQIADMMGMIGHRNPIYRLWYRWHRWVLQRAEIIITISQAMADTLQAMVPDTQLPIEVVPTWIDTDWIQPIAQDNNPFALEHQLDSRLIVLYSGNMGATHAIETIVDVAECLREDERILFVLIGDGTKRESVVEAISGNRTPNVRLLRWQPHDMLPYALASADIGVVTLSPGYEHLSMPSKTYSVMAAGNAVLSISPRTSDLAAITERYACGANFEPDCVHDIATWITTLANDRARLQALQDAAREAAVTHFSQQTCLPQLTQFVRQGLMG